MPELQMYTDENGTHIRGQLTDTNHPGDSDSLVLEGDENEDEEALK